ncbi:hypothetical protein B0H10DRAFT_2012151 [Mycena sp. CBHHK59/15]|nr:hypothetical protein B0H10DRAFT_2012151 [Mycena sp. CBHHK59/15]
MFKFNTINLDVWTETYSPAFYVNYLSRWPNIYYVQAAPSGRLMGYIIGNTENIGVFLWRTRWLLCLKFSRTTYTTLFSWISSLVHKRCCHRHVRRDGI